MSAPNRICFFLVVLFAVLNLGKALECYECESTSTIPNISCKPESEKKKCIDPSSVCLSAVYYQEREGQAKTYTSIKICYKENGHECADFIKGIQAQDLQVKADFYNKNCTVCTADGRCRNASPSLFRQYSYTSLVIFSTLLCFLSRKVFVY